MTKTTFGQIKRHQQFFTITMPTTPSAVYPNGLHLRYTKRTNLDAWDEDHHNLYGFKPDDVVFVK